MKQACPIWITKYAQFHNETRYSSSSRYLIYICTRGRFHDDGPLQQNCNGLADRIKGIMFMTRLASATGRILIINHTYPVDLTEGLVPTTFDWTAGNVSVPCDTLEFPCERIDSGGRNISATFWSSNGAYGDLPAWMIDGSLKNTSPTHVYMTSIHPPDFPLPGWAPAFPSHPLQGSHYHCLFSSLFKASHKVDQMARAFVEEVQSVKLVSEEYASLHLRMSIDERVMAQPEIHASFICARLLADEHMIQYVYLACDDSKVRTDVINGLHPGFVTMGFTPINVHAMDPTDSIHHTVFAETVAEFIIMARSKCLIMSRSGYSEAAQWMGGQACWSTVHQCAEMFALSGTHHSTDHIPQ